MTNNKFLNFVLQEDLTMREILFRGKREDNGEWVEGRIISDYVIIPKGQRFYISDNILDSALYAHIVVPETVGQYTGLTDKNGRKIFEGDIIKYSTNKIGIINYGTACFSVQDIKSRNNPAVDIVISESPNGVEIIGNIYDNPEFIEI